ncbi:MAG: class II aldolase/adducin family protein [Treponema sp.]|nr:class II aldolase/adducin family protein [Treponema sp.]
MDDMEKSKNLDEIKKAVADTGRILLEKKLVARTWGNFSARIDDNHFAITPSGLGYEELSADDIPVFNMEDESWEGGKKPSSEKRIHKAVYKQFSDVNFVVHTHPDYATAIGLVPEKLDEVVALMTEEEKTLLGTIRVADYGLPGTKTLKNAVESSLSQGAKIVLMLHHGAVIGGTNREDAIHKAEVLEQVCKKAFDAKNLLVAKENTSSESFTKESFKSDLENALYQTYPNYRIVTNPLLEIAAQKGSFKVQLDDMAQMIGGVIHSVAAEKNAVLKALKKQDAVLVKGLGCVLKSENPDDLDALELLITKSAIAKLYTDACNKKISLSAFDCWLMRTVYKNKYSKKKNQNQAEKGETEKKDTEKKKEFIRVIKFFLFSVSAGVIEIVAFTLLNELAHLPYWVSYLVALVLSVLWNFTFNRKFTFKAANNVPIAMLKVACYYAVFTPLTTLLEHKLTGLGWNEYLVTLINMALNLTTEYLYDRFVVFRASLDTNQKAKK